MKLIPSDKIELKTNLSIQEVRKVLGESIQPKRALVSSLHKPKNGNRFEGTFERDEFKIQRIINGRKSFLPLITGKIQSDSNGTILKANFNVRKPIIIFILFSLIFVGFILIMGIIGVVNQGANPILLVIPLMLIMFEIALINSSFSSERDKSINDLKEIINV